VRVLGPGPDRDGAVARRLQDAGRRGAVRAALGRVAVRLRPAGRAGAGLRRPVVAGELEGLAAAPRPGAAHWRAQLRPSRALAPPSSILRRKTVAPLALLWKSTSTRPPSAVVISTGWALRTPSMLPKPSW